MKLLLIASNAFSKNSNNGKTYESLLKKLKRDEIAQLYFSYNEKPDFDYCDNYFKISDIDVLKSIIKFNGKCGEIVIANYSPQNSNFTLNSEKQTVAFFKKIISPFFRDILWSFGKWDSKDLRDWYNGFNPDIVMFVGSPAWYANNIAIKISDQLNIPLVTYYTDDYVVNSIKKNIFYPLKKLRINRIYNKTVKRSSLLFAIGEEMAKVYSSYFSKEFYPIMNSVPIADYFQYTESNHIIISYFGGLHLNRWRMIARVARLLPQNASLNIYSMTEITSEMAAEFKHSRVNYCGSVTGNDLKDKIIKSDILLHVESDEKYLRRLTSLSVSTKIPEYLISGRPILGFGPREVASMKILSDNKIGVVISSENCDIQIQSELQNLISNFNNRKDIGINGYKYAVKKFDNIKITEKFTKQLESLIK